MSLEGKIIGNRYEVLEKIGIGGMATVYKAKDNILKRNVAVKVLRDEFTTDEEFIKRFNTEAQAAASLTHPNIVSIYDVRLDSSLKIKDFREMTDEWLDFIINCRAGKTHDYDIVIGAMADDQIYNYVSDYMDGSITREQFWVLAKFKYPTHQINFCSKEALKCLEYRGFEVVK